MGVDQRDEHPLEARTTAETAVLPSAKFFANALEDQDV